MCGGVTKVSGQVGYHALASTWFNVIKKLKLEKIKVLYQYKFKNRLWFEILICFDESGLIHRHCALYWVYEIIPRFNRTTKEFTRIIKYAILFRCFVRDLKFWELQLFWKQNDSTFQESSLHNNICKEFPNRLQHFLVLSKELTVV